MVSTTVLELVDTTLEVGGVDGLRQIVLLALLLGFQPRENLVEELLERAHDVSPS